MVNPLVFFPLLSSTKRKTSRIQLKQKLNLLLSVDMIHIHLAGLGPQTSPYLVLTGKEGIIFFLYQEKKV